MSPKLPTELSDNPPREVPASAQAGEKVAKATKEAPKKSAKKPTKKAVKATAKKKKKTTKKQRSGGGARAILLGVFGFFALLILFFYGAMIASLLTGGADSATFQSLGMAPVQVRSFLLTITNVIFGLTAFVLFIVALIRFFGWFMTSAKSKLRRPKLVRAVTTSLLMVLSVVLWMALYLLITTNLQGASATPNASFIRTDPVVTRGLTAPVLVQFDVGEALAAEGLTQYVQQIKWDIENDGTPDYFGPTVSHQFTDRGKAEGRYPVTVTISYTDAAGNEQPPRSETKDVFIDNERVSAQFQAFPDRGPSPLLVTFDAAEAFDPDGQIIRYEWDFDGDGQYEMTGQDLVSVERELTAIGDYEVTLRVTGANGETATLSQMVAVEKPDGRLTAVMSSTEPWEGVPPHTMTLDGGQSFSQLGRIIRYEWWIEGENQPQLGQTLNRTFRRTGTYEVKLRVTNEDGERAEQTKIVKVLLDPSDAQVRIDTVPQKLDSAKALEGTVPLTVNFSAARSDVTNVIDWQWDLDGDGSADAYTETAEFTYRTAGQRTVTLTMVDADQNEYKAELPIDVSRAGTASRFTPDPPSGVVPLAVGFDGSASTTDEGEIIDYIWTFDEQPPLHAGAQVDFEFTSVGVFPVKLQILTSTGEKAESEQYISVRELPLRAQFAATPANGEAPLKVRFDAGASEGTISRYEWDFGDGRTSDRYSPTHIYATPGTYAVELKVTDKRGVIDTFTDTVKVAAPAAPAGSTTGENNWR